jgi:hypothetical protein
LSVLLHKVDNGKDNDGVVFELALGPNLVDNNILVGSGDGGTGIGSQDASGITIVHNLIVNYTGDVKNKGASCVDLHGLTGRSQNGSTAALKDWHLSANVLLGTGPPGGKPGEPPKAPTGPWIHIHPEKKGSKQEELVMNDTVVHNLVHGLAADCPSCSQVRSCQWGEGVGVRGELR